MSGPVRRTNGAETFIFENLLPIIRV